MTGVVTELGDSVSTCAVGDRVCGSAFGGGLAEYAVLVLGAADGFGKTVVRVADR